ncbi:MAG: response regulator [Magnetococcales bacterium]|nr:response regulator [Magnetococcales bacterium]
MPLPPQTQVVLIVDDEPVNIEVLNEILQDDYRVLFATRGVDALEIARAQRPDLILLDVMMPEMDGREVCARIKADPDLQEIPVIFVTAMSGEMDETIGLEAGAVDYITKPVSPAVVQLRVKNQLELKRHRDRLEELVKARTLALSNAHDAAREREELLWTVFASSLDAFIMMDAQGKVVEFNPAASALFGYSREQLIGQDLAEFIIPPEWRSPYRQALAHANQRLSIEGGSPVGRRMSVDGLRADGKMVDLEVTVSLVRAHGQPLYTAFLRDITSAKQLRISLNAALSTAESAFRAKDLFLANMSHEIRTPMNGVLGMIDLALGSDSHDRVREFLSHAKSSSHILLRVINDILDYSKIESGKLLMESVDFYLGDVLADAINLFRQMAIDKDLELVISAPPQSIGMLVGDRLRLQQILVNLVSNAIKFTQEGGIQIKAVLVEETEERVRLEFAVKDTGIGISEEQIALLFSPFVQADSSITRQFGGTGLGLTICKRLVEMMGGEIWIASTPQVGSTFYFTVMLGRNRQTTPYRPLLPDDLHGTRTLVVDDNLDARVVTSEMLNQMGMLASAVESGQQGLDTLLAAVRQGTPYALVLLDWRMPDMNGLETAQRILAEPLLNGATTGTTAAARPIKIIMMTAFGKEEIMQQARRAGVGACLIKPMTPSLLLDTILDVFEKTSTKVYDTRLHGIDKTAVIRHVGGATVLLAEDNPINQRVAREMLENLGLTVTVVNNGQEAIHLLLNQSFDLVFMDVQMPVLDGYQATRQLRAMESFQTLPIIAMTAHALVGDRENCLAAGMSDYMAKPIDLQQLFRLLIRWIKPQGNPVNVSALLTQAAEREDTQKGLEDLPGIQVQAALAALGATVAFYKEMWRDFARDHQQDTEKIRAALFVTEDADSARLHAHSIKGMAGNLGARRLYAAAHDLELAIAHAHRDEWPRLLELFEQAMVEVLQSVTTLLDQETAAGPLEHTTESTAWDGDREAVARHVATMTHWLQKGSLEATESLEPLRRLLSGSPWQQELSRLERAVDQFAFDAACQHLAAIAAHVRQSQEKPNP